ncbi:TIGR02444 family protein [Pseudomonas sp. TH10]|uniref:TIGR02444 family protein n=1 Tax=Pseudomonas sp. TH10 TaxID=2796376 RepID=UPI0019149929|nr:TIGR02444 family protein [Pseudomonas sp. TH10]MBK5517821.1 TIGR02444 family protein [Pseudomonas sp. TH10]
MSSDLWSFSLATYARPGAERACLQLQSAGTNVCLLLCGLWLEHRGVVFNELRLLELREVVEGWDAGVIQPLRALRGQWKAAAADDTDLNILREKVKALELEGERILLSRLEKTAQQWPQNDKAGSTAWLEGVAADTTNVGRDALHQLRVAVTGT